MGFRVNANSAIMAAHRRLGHTTDQLSKSMERLSSGLRINRPSDDPALSGVADRLRAQASGISVAKRNVQDAMGLVSTGEEGLTQMVSILQRARDLAVEYNSGMLDANQQFAITTEIIELRTRFNNLVTDTQYRGNALLTSNGGALLTLQVGAEPTDTMTLPRINVSNALTGLPAGGVPNITDIDGDLNEVIAAQTTFASSYQRLEGYSDYLDVYEENILSQESRIRDVDMAMEMSEFTRLQVMHQAGMAMVAQANLLHSSVLALLQQ